MVINQTISIGILLMGLGIMFVGLGAFFRGLGKLIKADRESMKTGLFKKK